MDLDALKNASRECQSLESQQPFTGNTSQWPGTTNSDSRPESAAPESDDDSASEEEREARKRDKIHSHVIFRRVRKQFDVYIEVQLDLDKDRPSGPKELILMTLQLHDRRQPGHVIVTTVEAEGSLQRGARIESDTDYIFRKHLVNAIQDHPSKHDLFSAWKKRFNQPDSPFFAEVKEGFLRGIRECRKIVDSAAKGAKGAEAKEQQDVAPSQAMTEDSLAETQSESQVAADEEA